ncbi:hypothetical protein KKA13_03785 [Patescibacteria group bacterium]|nr:hypothetical protein [Patescibacteria group bacterium]MBU1612880.1 hypothetical protein [Patescibacteria group bacterium]
MSVLNLFYWSYWFNQPYIARGWVMWVWVGGFLGLVLTGIIMRMMSQIKEDNLIKEVFRRFSNLGVVMGVCGLVWLFLRQQRVPFLAWRFWLLFWLIILIWWLVKVLRYSIKRIPEIKREQTERMAKEKYLPKKK